MDQTSARIELQKLNSQGQKLLEGPFQTLFTIWGERGYWHEADFGLHGSRALSEFQEFLFTINFSLNVLAGYTDTLNLNSLRAIQEIRDLNLELNTFISEVLNGKPMDDLSGMEGKFKSWKELFQSINFLEIETALKKAEDKEIFLKKRAIAQFSAPLYHGVKLEHLKGILDRSSLEVRTVHRYWRDGLRRFDHREENYDNCEWIKGISMTRDFDYAGRWGHVVLVLNWNELKKNLSFMPVAWFRTHPKREREEFLYFENQKDKYKTDEETGRMSREQFDQFKESVGEIKLTDENFYGFYIRTSNYYSEKDWEELTQHPKFLGMYSR